MFAHLSSGNALTVRSAAALTATETKSLTHFLSLSGSSGFIVIVKSTSRTVGQVTVSFLGGVTSDAINIPLGSDMTKVVTTGTYTFIPFTGQFPPYLSVVLTPAGGYDGTLSVITRSGMFNPVSPV